MTIGVDEVGRGCWAGPLVAAAVGLEDDHEIIGLGDSKKLTAIKRYELAKVIQRSTSMIGLGWVWPSEINSLGLTESVRLAMNRAIDQIELSNLEIIVDGNINYLNDFKNSRAVVKADGLIESVSAASIIAKVARDTYMVKIAEKYPDYGFEAHVGYGTRRHVLALETHGITAIHRIKYKPIMRYL